MTLLWCGGTESQLLLTRQQEHCHVSNLSEAGSGLLLNKRKIASQGFRTQSVTLKTSFWLFNA